MSEPTRHEHALRQMLKTANIQIGEMRAEADVREKKITELWALVEIVKEVDSRFGHMRKLKRQGDSGVHGMLGEVTDIIHRVAQAAESEEK